MLCSGFATILRIQSLDNRNKANVSFRGFTFFYTLNLFLKRDDLPVQLLLNLNQANLLRSFRADPEIHGSVQVQKTIIF